MREYDCNRILKHKKYFSLKAELSDCLDICGIKAYGFDTPKGQRGVYFYVDKADVERFNSEFLENYCVRGPQHRFFFTMTSENKYFASSHVSKSNWK